MGKKKQGETMNQREAARYLGFQTVRPILRLERLGLLRRLPAFKARYSRTDLRRLATDTKGKKPVDGGETD